VSTVADETSRVPIPPSEDERELLIRERAYQLWQSEGCPEGRDEEYWHRAHAMIDAETQTSYPPTQSRSNRT
jgi:hypothetical protein